MAKKRNSKKNKNGVTVDLTGVETGVKAIPEGRYTVKVAEAELAESQSGNPMLKITFEVVEGKKKGAKLFENCSLQPQALFKLKALLLALDYEIPEGAFDLDVDELIDMECDVEVAHETYEGKKRSRIVEYITGEDGEDDEDDDEDEEDDDDEDDDDEDEEEDDDEEDEEDDDEEDDYESMSLKELKALAKERGIKVTKKDDKDSIIGKLEEADEEDDDEEDEEEEDLESMTLKELKALAKERGLKVKKGMGKDEIIELLEEDDD